MLRKFIFHPSLVTDGWVSLDSADIGLFESVYKKSLREGEERLMLAVLESAVEDFQKYVLARKPRGKKLFQEAEEWFLERDSDELFSFENICDTLQLHPDYIRQGLLRWKEAKLKTLSVEAHRQGRTELASTRIRHHPVRLSKIA
jgi:hypothetical protein